MAKTKDKESISDSSHLVEAEALIEELMAVLKDAGDWRHVDTPVRHGAIVRAVAMAEAYKDKWKA